MNQRAPQIPDSALPEGADLARLAAYRGDEPIRRFDPFSSKTLQVAIAAESERRVERERRGSLASIASWLISAPRPALASAALSFALLAVALPSAIPSGAVSSAKGEVVRSAAPMSAVGTSPLGGPERNAAEDLAASETLTAAPLDPTWLLVVGATGLALSLFALERARRRRRA